METAAFLGLLGLGYFANSKRKPTTEGFTDSTATVAPGADRTPVGQPTVPGFPRQPSPEYDQQFQLPAGGSLPSEPNPSSIRGGPLRYATAPSTLPTQTNVGVAASMLQTRPDGWEDATPRGGFISPLSGVEYKSGEFKHSNMVPFFRGQLKQNMKDSAYNNTLDEYTGGGKYTFEKREQAPMFEPTKEPMGNVHGLESTTNFMESRITESRNRANEAPVERIRVGRGLNQGYNGLPSGGFHETVANEYIMERVARTDELRTANNPKMSYTTGVVTGAHYNAVGGTAESIGEVRKYNADTFFINEHGERNFVTTGADVKPAARAAQVMKHTTRPETTVEYTGAAGQAEGNATYNVPSMRAPLVKQMGNWGFRNADATEQFNPNTDAEQNDYGKSGVEIRPNERYYTGERVHATNLAPDAGESTMPLQDGARQTRAEELIQHPRSAGNFTALGGGGMAEKPALYDPNDTARTTIKETTIDNDWIGMAAPAEAQPRMTVYDPNDTARTTIRETTEDNDWIGVAAPANAAQKLTVYDPDDIARPTGRNTLADWDLYRNMGRQDLPGSSTVRPQDKVRLTQKGAISAKSSYTGVAQATEAFAETNRENAKAMRHYAQRETVAAGRVPMGSSTKVFNGEDNVNMQYKRIASDSVNDRSPAYDRVASDPVTMDAIGIQRPRNVLKLDVSGIRNEPLMVSSLESNPYVISLQKRASARV